MLCFTYRAHSRNMPKTGEQYFTTYAADGPVKLAAMSADNFLAYTDRAIVKKSNIVQGDEGDDLEAPAPGTLTRYATFHARDVKQCFRGGGKTRDEESGWGVRRLNLMKYPPQRWCRGARCRGMDVLGVTSRCFWHMQRCSRGSDLLSGVVSGLLACS